MTQETSTKEKAQPALIKQFVYEFKSKDRLSLDLDDKSKIFLVINGIETTIPIENLFIGSIDTDDEDVMGYSILQLITGGTQLKIDENTVLTITFIDKTSGREFYISKIRRPLMYDEDMEISPESRLRYIDLLLKTSMLPIESQKQAEKEAMERAAAEAEAARQAEVKKEAEQRHQIEKEAKEKQEAENALIPGGVNWEEQRNDLVKIGLTEYAFENYRMFYKNADDENPAEIGFFILHPGSYEFIELYEEEITDEKEEYSFEDDKEDEFRVVFDKVKGVMKVE